MKVVFIYLPKPYLKEPGAQAPLGLMYLAAVLEREGFDVEIADLSSCTDADAIDSVPKADIYGITATSMEVSQANRLAWELSLKYPGSVVGLGGPCTVDGEFIDHHVFDFICKGETEGVIADIVRDCKAGGLRYEYIGVPVDDLDSLPFPARHLLDNQGGNIFAYGKNYEVGGSTIICTSRGCPYSCSFCAAPALNGTKKVRYRSPGNVAREIRHVIDTLGIKQFRFSDDMFLADKRRVYELCDLVGPLGVSWRISTRVKPFSRPVAKRMWEAGCREVSFGIESFDEAVLRVLNKGTTPADNARALYVAKEAGLVTRALFMIRTPGQTSVTVPTNIAWLERVPYDIVACTSFVPLPGSDIWRSPDKYGIEILNRNLDDYNFYFFGPGGENELKDIIKIKDRTLEEFNGESQMFRDYLKATGRLNKG